MGDILTVFRRVFCFLQLTTCKKYLLLAAKEAKLFRWSVPMTLCLTV